MSNKLKDAEANNNDLWTLTDHVIMHLMGFNHTINPKDASL
jgi:ssRNA-specific RNase YbeY (16S rRNA maturation enzyme)